MADIERLQRALVAADQAGDVEAATTLARALRQALRPRDLRAENPAEYDPTSPGFQQRYGSTSAMGTGQRLAAGAGKFLFDLGRGVKQLTGNLSREEVDERKALDAPLMSTTSGKVGNIGGGLAFGAPLALIPGVNTYTGAALAGGAMGALQPVGTSDSRALNVGLGAAGGAAGKFVGDRLAAALTRPRQTAGSASQAASQASATATPGVAETTTTVTGGAQATGRGGGSVFGTVGDDPAAGLTASQRQIAERGKELGFRLTPGQATGSRALQQMEAKLESQPMTSGPFNAIKERNQRALNRAVAEAIGENADTVDSTVLDRAFTRLGQVFRDAADETPRQIDPRGFLQTFSEIQDDIRGIVSGFGEHPLVEDLTKLAQAGQATGKQLQSLTSKLGKAAYKQMTMQSGDRDLGLALYRLKDYVDDLLQQGMDESRAQAFQQARQQYRNLIMLTSRVGVVNPSTGNVSGRSLANVLQSKDKMGFLRGQNQSAMYDAARFAQAFQPIVGDSGTATRSMVTSPTDFVLSLPFNLATRAYTSSPSVNLAVGTQAAANAASRSVGPVAQSIFEPTAPFLPRYLPVYGGLLGANAQ